MNKHLIAAGALTLAVAGGSTGVVAAQSAPARDRVRRHPEGGRRSPPGRRSRPAPRRSRSTAAARARPAWSLVRLNQGVTIEEFGERGAEDPGPERRPQVRPDRGEHVHRRQATTTRRRSSSPTPTTSSSTSPKQARGRGCRSTPGPGASGAVAPAARRVGRPARLPVRDALVAEGRQADAPGHATTATSCTTRSSSRSPRASTAPRLMKKIKAGKEPRKEFAGPPSALVEIVSPETRNDVEVEPAQGQVPASSASCRTAPRPRCTPSWACRRS